MDDPAVFKSPGKLLAERLVAATRNHSSEDQRRADEEAELQRLFTEGHLISSIPEALPDFTGFEHRRHRFGPCWWRKDDRILVFDAEPGNFVKSSEGLIPVDVIIQQSENDPTRIS